MVAAFRFAGLGSLAAALGIPAGCSVPVFLSSRSEHVESEGNSLSLGNQGKRDVCHFCLHKHQLTPHFQHFLQPFTLVLLP